MSEGEKKPTPHKPAHRTGLGRGLSSLLGDVAKPEPVAAPVAAPVVADDGSTSSAVPSTPAPVSGGVHHAPVEFVHPGRYQPRHAMDESELKDLAQSIREKGVLQPLLVRPHPDIEGQYELIAGERRWRAAQLAQLHQVPVLVHALSDLETMEVGLIENLQRQDLSPLEEADGYRRLMDEFSHTQEQLANAVGKSRPHVANMLRLLSLPDAVKTMLDDGRLSAGHARALLASKDPYSVAEKVVKSGLNVRQTEALVKKEQGGGGSGKGKGPGKDADTLALERELASLLGLKVDIQFKKGRGVLSVHYQSLEQLDDILHRLTRGEHGSKIGE